MYDQIREDFFFIMIYSAVTTTALMASCYLLFRRGNAFAPDITPPARLRRWTAVFFALIALNHIWYLPLFWLTSDEDVEMADLVGGLLDCIVIIPLAIALLIVMLQDRRRPLWPVAVVMAPLVVDSAYSVATRSYAFLPIAYAYFLLMCIGLIIYMVRALRQYGSWLRDNYADLEHKEVWQSFAILAIMLLMFAAYAFVSEGPVYQYAMQLILFVLIYYLLWRVETLSDLSIPDKDAAEDTVSTENVEDNGPSLSIRNKIGPLLKQHCEEPMLYTQYDLTLSQLAQTIGINRLYISQYFSSQGLNYNMYINGLRIKHFISLYRKATAAHQPITAQQLAYESGFRSYNTFSVAFKPSNWPMRAVSAVTIHSVSPSRR